MLLDSATRRARVSGSVLFLLSVSSAAWAADCSGGSYDSTLALLQKVIFENRGCTSQVCHGAPGAPSAGGLDLRPEVAYDNLVEVNATTVTGMQRVVPGRHDASLLFINLAAATDPTHFKAPLRAMPIGLPPISANELDALRRWIEAGAPKDGVVTGTADQLDACLPPPKPLTILPLPPPAAGTGVQLRMPPVELKPQHEQEVCFAMYYDITDQVPPQFRSPDGKNFLYNASEVRQDPQSHHLIVSAYTGEAAPDDPAWGPFRCRGGDHAGETCVPTDQTFCGDGMCAADPVKSPACIGYGPTDAQAGVANSGFTGSQETATASTLPPGIYAQAPMKGMLLFDSHAFNFTDTPGEIRAWMNFKFAPPAEQITPLDVIFDTSTIFKMNVPAFQTEEICTIYALPQHANLSQLSSHGHKWMKRWRTFDGAWTCRGGANDGQACEPLGYDFVSPDVCQGRPCSSEVYQHVGDCNGDGAVSIDELIASVNIALGGELSVCNEADSNADSSVSVDEILRAVNAALNGVPAPMPRDPFDSLLYVSLIYNDPVVLNLDPPMVMSSPAAAERSLTYCALYDNGYTNPSEVKTRANSPAPPIPIPGIGGPCQTPTGCTAGKIGAACQGHTEKQRNASCDSSPGAGDGFCDACTLKGGMTTGDEMFILMGQYYVPGQ
ncbi:MAG TPA: EF-hand domain-containing protein [Candidatus Acidoferrales bacterium]|nr:EF-hand domain-containing protein [Candidatus Acidoferrales bacterium]